MPTQYLRFEFDNLQHFVPDFVEHSHEVRATFRIHLVQSSGNRKTLLEVDCNMLYLLTWVVETHVNYKRGLRIDGMSIAQAIAHYFNHRKELSPSEKAEFNRYRFSRSLNKGLPSVAEIIPIYIGWVGIKPDEHDGEISCLCEEKTPQEIGKNYPSQRISYEMGEWRYFFFYSEYIYHLRDFTRETLFMLQNTCEYPVNLETIAHLLEQSEEMLKRPEIIAGSANQVDLSQDEIIILLDSSTPFLGKNQSRDLVKRYALNEDTRQIFEFSHTNFYFWQGKPIMPSDMTMEAREYVFGVWLKKGRIDEACYQRWMQTNAT